MEMLLKLPFSFEKFERQKKTNGKDKFHLLHNFYLLSNFPSAHNRQDWPRARSRKCNICLPHQEQGINYLSYHLLLPKVQSSRSLNPELSKDSDRIVAGGFWIGSVDIPTCIFIIGEMFIHQLLCSKKTNLLLTFMGYTINVLERYTFLSQANVKSLRSHNWLIKSSALSM